MSKNDRDSNPHDGWQKETEILVTNIVTTSAMRDNIDNSDADGGYDSTWHVAPAQDP